MKMLMLIKKLQNHLRLLEVAQVPKDNIEDFKSVKKFNVFNTNNLWISLPAVQRVIEEGTLDMEVIVNPKTLDGGVNVIQLEVRRLQNYIYDRLFY
jgi:UTP--glucose-1-phosphate uridylyltransferase